MPAPEEIDPDETAVEGPEETAVEDREASVAPVPHPADSLQARIDPSAGPTRLGRYVLLREIGRGAIGVVYAAYHEGLDRKLAIKVLNKQRAGRLDLEARLKREARALAKLSHPNVVQVYDVGEFAGRVFVAMEFVEGQPLSDWMRLEHTIPEIVAMFAEAGRGLAAAHEAGVIHRDFKPDNVLVGKDGRPRVLDFGLARAAEHEAEDAVAGPIGRLRESGPIAASLDQLLGSALRSRTLGDSFVRGTAPQPELDPDATIDIASLPVPTTASADQDLILTQTSAAVAELRALDVVPATAIPANESSHVDATLPPERPAGGNALATRLGDTMASLADDPRRDDDEFAETIYSDVERGSVDGGDVLTRTGAMMGTPAYMSPEQFLGGRVDQASDQFSFCVALYEALYGHRPFKGTTTMDLAMATQEGQINDAPANSPVPGWLRAILLRGLSPASDDRFESMQDLIAELVRDREPRVRRWWPALGLAAVAAVALALGRLAPDDEPPCATVEARVEQLWSDAQAGELHQAFERSTLPYADAAWAGVESRLRAWAGQWAEQQVEACTATHVRREFSPEVLDLRQACLDRQLRRYQALLEQLRHADATIIEHALEATASLPEPARCADVDALLSGLPQPPAELAATIEQLRTELANLDAMASTGNAREGLAEAAAAVERARTSGYEPVLAEALLTQARLLAGAGEGEQAVASLQDALDAAERSGYDELVPRVTIELVSLSIYVRPDPIRGRVWARWALASLDHLGEQGIWRARGIWSLANLERLDGHYAAAETQLLDAIARLDAHAPKHPERAIMLNDLGNAIAGSGDAERARATYERARDESIAAFGAGHPRVGHAYYNLANLAFEQGRLDDARAELEHARAIYVAARGPQHRDVGSVELLLAAIDISVGELDRAEAHAALADHIYTAELADDNVDRAEPQLVLGHVAFARKRYPEAAKHYRAALAQQRASLPPGHISMADTHINLGLVQLSSGDADGAVPELQRAVELLEGGAGVDPDVLRRARLYLGDALLARAAPGDLEHARRRFEAALVGCTPDSELCQTLQARVDGPPG